MVDFANQNKINYKCLPSIYFFNEFFSKSSIVRDALYDSLSEIIMTCSRYKIYCVLSGSNHHKIYCSAHWTTSDEHAQNELKQKSDILDLIIKETKDKIIKK